MNHDARYQVILAEMARAVRIDHPDADWHEVEPLLRRIWNHAPRQPAWDEVRSQAAHHWRFGCPLPPLAAVVIEPQTAAGRSP